MASRGGYRKPANPAPVSGPGKLSRRTDGAQPKMNMTGGKYGEATQLNELQSGAPMAQAPSGAEMQANAPSMPAITPLFDPTQRPEEPITAGMPFGPGDNSIPGGNPFSQPGIKNVLEKALALNNDPELEVIYNYLRSRGVI